MAGPNSGSQTLTEQQEKTRDLNCDFCSTSHETELSRPESVLHYQNDIESMRKLVTDLLPHLRDVANKSESDAASFESFPRTERDRIDEQNRLLGTIAFHLEQLRSSNPKNLESALKAIADASRDEKWQHDLVIQSPEILSGWPPELSRVSDYRPSTILRVAILSLHHRHDSAAHDCTRQAIRIVSNCCASGSLGKKLVMENGGMELLVRCLNRHVWDDIVPIALWNLCALSEDVSGETEEARVASAMIARRQLTLLSTGERGDGLLDVKAPTRPHIIKDLLRAATRVQDRSRRERLAELIEWASNNIREPPSEDQIPLSQGTRLREVEIRAEDFLSDLFGHAGRALAATSFRCNMDVKRTILNVLSGDALQSHLISLGLEQALLLTLEWKVDGTPDSDDESDTEEDDEKEEAAIQRLLEATVYKIVARPDFLTIHKDLDPPSSLVQACLDAIQSSSSPDPHRLPISFGCTILANLTVSPVWAIPLVQTHSLHLPLMLLLAAPSTPPTLLYPATSLMQRLSIPDTNKPTLLSSGLMDTLHLLLLRPLPAPTHQAALSSLISITTFPIDKSSSWSLSSSLTPFAAAITLFSTTDDPTTKVLVARLLVALARFLHRLFPRTTDDDDTDTAFQTALHTALPDPAAAMAPLVYLCEAAEKGGRVEGWLGLVLFARGPEWKGVLGQWVRGEGRGLVEKGLSSVDSDGDGDGEGKGVRENIKILLQVLDVDWDADSGTEKTGQDLMN